MIGIPAIHFNHPLKVNPYHYTIKLFKPTEADMKRSAIIISIIITTFVLGVVGGVVRAVSAANQSAEVQKLQATIQAREDLYTQAIAEANDRIQQANQEIQTIQQQSTATIATAAPTVQPTLASIPVDQALKIAMDAVGETGTNVSGHTDRVSYNGTVSYEVQLSDGSTLYLDASSGNILYNSLTGGPGKIIDDKQALFNAVTYMKGGQVLSVDKTTYNNVPAYLVTFTTGAKVYVNLAGQIIGVEEVQQYYTGYTSGSGSTSTGSSSIPSSKPSSSSSGGGESESGDD
jgi:uncharacterized membrane protein